MRLYDWLGLNLWNCGSCYDRTSPVLLKGAGVEYCRHQRVWAELVEVVTQRVAEKEGSVIRTAASCLKLNTKMILSGIKEVESACAYCIDGLAAGRCKRRADLLDSGLGDSARSSWRRARMFPVAESKERIPEDTERGW